jgi:hypothetical protein
MGVMEAFDARWPTTLKVIQLKDLRTTIWDAVKPGVIYVDGLGEGRYWPLRCSIWPSRSTPECPAHATDDGWADRSEPMPIVM